MCRNAVSKIRNSDRAKVPFGSNCVRLFGCEWLIVGIFVSTLFCFGPTLWKRIEKFEPGPNYRLPYELGNDYWLQARYCRWACSRDMTLLVGDSVIWGHYVSRHNTLSGYLNKIVAREQFANMGVDGIHPVALAGLLKYYGRDISGKNVILHFNPLWMSSRKHDLQTEKEFAFNHPRLAPQFIPNIPCYKASYSERISAVVARSMPFFSWKSHLSKIYFNNMDLPTWTLEHPYKIPKFEIETVKRTTVKPSDRPAAWYEKGIVMADFDWVELETSLQWDFFRRSIRTLKARGNNIFVLVGPFNEHMLTKRAGETYRRIKNEIEAWLRKNNVAYCIPSALPSRLYRDASHPLSEGYFLLAKQLFENESFQKYLSLSIIETD